MTSSDQFQKRMRCHEKSSIFENGFDVAVLFRHEDRKVVAAVETKFVHDYDTFKNGLNKTVGGKGHGHRSENFTMFGKKHKIESRELMSKSKIALVSTQEWKDRQSKISSDNWKRPEYRAKQSWRKGVCLKKTIPLQEHVKEIVLEYQKFFVSYTPTKSKNGRLKNAAHAYALMVCEKYGVTSTAIRTRLQNEN